MNGGREQRMVPAAAVATLAVALSLHALVEGWAWFVGCVVTVGVVAGAGAGVRRLTKQPVVVVVSQVVALVVVLTVLFVREQAVLGLLPGAEAVRAVSDLVAEGVEVSQAEAAPVQPATGVLLLVAFGIGAIAVLVDALSVTLRRPALAGLPLLAVYCVPSAILLTGTSWVWFVVAAGAFLLLLAAEGGDRVRGWGRVLSGERTGAARVNLTSATGARQVALGAIALAVVAPALLPAFPVGPPGSSALFPWGNGPGGGEGRTVTTINPILDLRRNLRERSDDVVLEYTTDDDSPSLLRVLVDENFDGEVWTPSEPALPAQNRVQDGLPNAPGLTEAVATQARTTAVEIGPQLDQTYLPLPYPARTVDIQGVWLYNESTLDVLGRDERTAGLNYLVEHLEVTPSGQQLADAGPVPRDFDPATRALPTIPDVVRSEARRVGGNGSAFEQAVNLQQWFRSAGGFQYSVEAPGSGSDDGSLDVMEAFLAEKRGYCVHFASTMAVMARTLGIPARVAVGFLPGEAIGQDRYQVRFRDAHAWPELYFTGVGWVRFEPTPSVQTGQAPNYTLELPDREDSPTPGATAPLLPSVAPTQVPRDEAPAVVAGERSTLETVLDVVPWRWLLVLVGVLGLGIAPRGLAAARRWWRWRAVRTRSDRAEAAWDELAAWCADLGIAWPVSSTPRAVRDELVGGHELTGPARTALDRLLGDLEQARYAPPTGDPGRDVSALRGDVRTVADALAASAPAPVRRRALWLPLTAAQGVPSVDRDPVYDRTPTG